jgi:hypothetical protein
VESASIETITPEIASSWLERCNSHNRDLQQSTVDTYASDMAAGRWHFNGDAIRFSRNGVLLDGQHRLWAIVQSGCTQTSVVVRGLPDPAQLTIDLGKRRTPKDQLHMADIPVSNSVAAAIGVYLTWQTGKFFGDQVRLKITTPHKVEFAQQNPEIVRLLRSYEANATRVPCRPSVALAVSLKLHEIDDQDADDFFTSLATGANLAPNSPILTLRNRLLRLRETRVIVPDRDLVAFFIQAWNAHREGRTLAKLQRPAGATWSRETFPVPR